MLFHHHTITVLLTAGLAAASVLNSRAVCSESQKRICYGDGDGGEPQGLDRPHIQYIADYLRYLGRDNKGSGGFWTMPPTDSGCAEWELPVPDAGPVLALAKHTSPWLTSSVRYEDLAAAVDGDEGLLGCGESGGQVGVTANLTNSLYDTEEYKKSGAKPEGILVKLVKAPAV